MARLYLIIIIDTLSVTVMAHILYLNSLAQVSTHTVLMYVHALVGIMVLYSTDKLLLKNMLNNNARKLRTHILQTSATTVDVFFVVVIVVPLGEAYH